MNLDDTTLLDCGHVGSPTGICQYASANEAGCANQLCEQCVDECDTCRCVLCPRHQFQLADGARTFCADHTAGYVAQKLLSALISR